MGKQPETYISIDIETDGSTAGVNSMLALGAVAFNEDGDDVSRWYQKLTPLPNPPFREDPETMAWWLTQENAWREVCCDQREPEAATRDFVQWCQGVKREEGDTRLVAAAWPAAFDFSFVNWYTHTFVGYNPLGFACLDIRSYVDGLMRVSKYYGTTEKETAAVIGKVDKTGLQSHVAVDDALEQGRLLMLARKYAARVSLEERVPCGGQVPR